MRPGWTAEKRIKEKAERISDNVAELRDKPPPGVPFQLLCSMIEELQAEIEEIQEYLRLRGV